MRKIAIALALAGLSAPAFAQDTMTKPDVSFDTSVFASIDFATVDTDASGGISFDEMSKLVPDLTENDFNALDADGNGEISAEEYAVLKPMDASGTPAK